MGYTLGEAAKATGKTKGTISKALKNGRISGKKNEKGEWDITPSELHRLYPPVASDQDVQPVSNATAFNPDLLIENREMRVKLEALHKQFAMLENERDDLRRRLDTESEERRKLTLMLTHEHAEKKPQKPTESFRARLGRWITGSGLRRL